MAITAVEIEGLQELLSKATNAPHLIGTPLRRFFTVAALAVQRNSRQMAPVDRGQLRASIAYEVDGAGVPTYATIGPGVGYGASVEFGIGDYNEGPGGLGQRRLPTATELEGWAQRHGMNAHAVAIAIQRRGGIPPNPYMRTGFEQSLFAIEEALDACGSDVERQWRG